MVKIRQKIIIASLILGFIGSIALNIIVINRYDLMDKITDIDKVTNWVSIKFSRANRVSNGIDPSLLTNRPFVYYVSNTTKPRLNPSKQIGIEIPNQLIIKSGGLCCKNLIVQYLSL